MWPYAIKIAVSNRRGGRCRRGITKRSPVWAALLASLPLTSLLAFVWLYLDTGETDQVAAIAHSILWLVLPSLVLFVLLPVLLRAGWGFRVSLGSSCAATAGAYAVMTWGLGRFGVHARPAGTIQKVPEDLDRHARKVAGQVGQLLAADVPARLINVIGYSRGATLALVTAG
jgi:hypothetical protein